MRPFVILCATLLLLTPSTVLSGQDEVVALRRQVQQLQAQNQELQRQLILIKADFADEVRAHRETTRQANSAIQQAVEIVKSRNDSSLTAEFKKLGYPVK